MNTRYHAVRLVLIAVALGLLGCETLSEPDNQVQPTIVSDAPMELTLPSDMLEPQMEAIDDDLAPQVIDDIEAFCEPMLERSDDIGRILGREVTDAIAIGEPDTDEPRLVFCDIVFADDSLFSVIGIVYASEEAASTILDNAIATEEEETSSFTEVSSFGGGFTYQVEEQQTFFVRAGSVIYDVAFLSEEPAEQERFIEASITSVELLEVSDSMPDAGEGQSGEREEPVAIEMGIEAGTFCSRYLPQLDYEDIFGSRPSELLPETEVVDIGTAIVCNATLNNGSLLNVSVARFEDSSTVEELFDVMSNARSDTGIETIEDLGDSAVLATEGNLKELVAIVGTYLVMTVNVTFEEEQAATTEQLVELTGRVVQRLVDDAP